MMISYEDEQASAAEMLAGRSIELELGSDFMASEPRKGRESRAGCVARCIYAVCDAVRSRSKV
jgi:hypothetical protein